MSNKVITIKIEVGIYEDYRTYWTAEIPIEIPTTLLETVMVSGFIPTCATQVFQSALEKYKIDLKENEDE